MNKYNFFSGSAGKTSSSVMYGQGQPGSEARPPPWSCRDAYADAQPWL